MSGTFIISFDCEGKWGMADYLAARIVESFSTANLLRNYRELLSLLDEFGFQATFAFVGAYTMSAEEFLDRGTEFEPLLSSPACPPIAEALTKKQYDGWFNPEAAALVSRAGHEIASHGFSHQSMGPEAKREVVRWELEALQRLELFRGRPLTFVYPRNRVGFVDELQTHSVTGYRQKREYPFGRVQSLLAELNLDGSAEPEAADSPVIPIPAGFFLNWRYGVRRMIPAGFTIRRWRALLNDAARQNRVVHLWSHPHNFLTGDAMLPMFREILRVADETRRDQGLVNRTQLDYVRHVKCQPRLTHPKP